MGNVIVLGKCNQISLETLSVIKFNIKMGRHGQGDVKLHSSPRLTSNLSEPVT